MGGKGERVVFGCDIHPTPPLPLPPACPPAFISQHYSLVSSVRQQDLIHVLLSRLHQGPHQVDGAVASLLAAAHQTRVLNAHRLRTQSIVPVDRDSNGEIAWVAAVYSPRSVYGESGKGMGRIDGIVNVGKMSVKGRVL